MTEPPPSKRWPATCRHIHAHERRGHLECVVIQALLERVSMGISVRLELVRVLLVPNCIRQSVTSCSYNTAGSKRRAWSRLVLARLQQQLVALPNIAVAHMRYANHTLPRAHRCRVVLHSRQRPRRDHDGLSGFNRVIRVLIWYLRYSQRGIYGKENLAYRESIFVWVYREPNLATWATWAKQKPRSP